MTTEAKAASLSSADGSDRTAVVLFHGFGGFPGFGSGIDILNQALQSRFGSDPDTFSSQAFADFQVEEAFNYLNTFDDLKNVVLIGYSLGGSSAFELSSRLSPEIFDLIIGIDPVSKPASDTLINVDQFKQLLTSVGFSDLTLVDVIVGNAPVIPFRAVEQIFLQLLISPSAPPVSLRQIQELLVTSFPAIDVTQPPATVDKGINYFQLNSTPAEAFQPQGATNIIGFDNFNVETLFSDPSITHETIDESSLLHQRIGNDISAATTVNKPVPEPSSTLGVLVLGAGGVLVLRKRKVA